MPKKPNIKDIIEWDYCNWSSALNYWAENTDLDFSQCVALELGARNGGLSLWLASKGCKVICSDIGGPSESAADLHKKYGVGHLIEYANIDATAIQYVNKFDIILFKSVLGGIGRNQKKELQQKAIEEIHKALKTGGRLLFAENLVASPLHSFLRQKFIRWGSDWRYVSIDEMNDFASMFSEYRYYSVGFSGAFGRTEWQRNLLGKLDRIIFNHIIPESWRYIIIGIAKK